VQILVIDDDQQVRRTLTALLQRAGHQVEALDHARDLKAGLRTPPDIAFVDVFMPDVDGFQALSHLRAVHPGVPVVMISGGGGPGLNACLPMATRLGAEAVLPKPVMLADLVRVIDALTRGPS
jgi:DNA-binding NtrC family response regulator